MVDRYRRWLDRKTAERCAKNLKRNGFDVRLVPTPEAACREMLAMITEFETFGIGGSETIRQIGIISELTGMGKTIHDHWKPDLSPDEVQAVRLDQGRCGHVPSSGVRDKNHSLGFPTMLLSFRVVRSHQVFCHEQS